MKGAIPSLYQRVRDRDVLLSAWRVIKANAERSGNKETRKAVAAFEEKLIGNIDLIQRQLRAEKYRFARAHGATPKKGKGKAGKRAIVIAPVRDRVVQRAILDALYANCSNPAVRAVLTVPTSVGGVPGRGIGHALALIEEAVARGAGYAIRSDIKNFFPSFPRGNVIDFLKSNLDDRAFLDLFERAITVELANRDALGDDVELFPLGADGVAQGSPLSVFAGNVVLREFDAELNSRGIVCVRYIDDFVLLAANKRAAEKALSAGLAILRGLKLEAYSPDDGSGKASAGNADQPFDFLGYAVVRGLNPPSKSSRNKLLEKIDAEISVGKKWIAQRAKEDAPDVRVRPCYIQTLAQIDNILRGWAGAFQHCRSEQTLSDLDSRIATRLADFERWFGERLNGKSDHVQQRMVGIRLLADSEPVPLPDVAILRGTATS